MQHSRDRLRFEVEELLSRGKTRNAIKKVWKFFKDEEMNPDRVNALSLVSQFRENELMFKGNHPKISYCQYETCKNRIKRSLITWLLNDFPSGPSPTGGG